MKKMKLIKSYIIALGVLTLVSCGDNFLDSEPLTNVTDGNFYKTPSDAYKALVGCYDGMQRIWASGIALPVAAEVMSDNAFGGTGNSDGYGYQMMDEFDKSRSLADQNLFVDNWTGYYKALYRCNLLIGKMDQIEWGTEEESRGIYEGEARFLRAYLYFDMVRMWENIPLIVEPTTENVPQADPDDVYTLIANDLLYAIENLADVSYADQPAAERGRVTKWAAESLMARVFLFYTGYYGNADLVGLVNQSQALGYLEDVIANSGHGLVEDFSALWPAASLDDYAGEDNKETIFAIKYTYTSSYTEDANKIAPVDGNHWMVMFGMREQFSYPYGNGWGGATVNPKLWDDYSDDDTRKAASIISIADEGIDFENQNKQREYTGFYNKKYSPMVDEDGNSLPVKEGAVNFMIGQYEDYVSIRYADVLLMAAELGSPNAQNYFDNVRERAYQGNFVSIPVNATNILNERKLEFALEGIRYYDLLRQGVNVAANTIAETTTVLNGGVSASKTISAAKILETRGFVQIPNQQITLSNGVLIQNDGW